MVTKRELGDILKKNRIKNGLTCETMSKMCGFASKGHIARIESGKYDIYFQTLQKVCSQLGLYIEIKERK